MCELYAVNSCESVRINDTLRIFYQHSVRHPHGWGLAHWQKQQAVIYREPCPAKDSEYLKSILQNPIYSKIALGHIRFATVGAIGIENCHPFIGVDCSGRNWTVTHNGTIFSGTELIPYEIKQKGRTDSERILLYLMDCIEEATLENRAPLNAQQRSQVVEKMALDLSPRNKLNFLIYDSEQLYVHTNMKDTLFTACQDNAHFFVTSPLENDFHWQRLPLNTVQTYHEGELVYQGEQHKNEFISVGLSAQDIGDFQI